MPETDPRWGELCGHAQNCIRRLWPDSSTIARELAELIDSHRRSQSTNMPMTDYNHMFIMLGYRIALAENQHMCLSAFEAALKSSAYPINT